MRSFRTIGVAVLAALSMLGAACSGDGEQAVEAGGTDADELIGAIDATRAGSGRFRIRWSTSGVVEDQGSEDVLHAAVVEGEFDSGSFSASAAESETADDEEESASGWSGMSGGSMLVDGRRLASLDSVRAFAEEWRTGFDLSGADESATDDPGTTDPGTDDEDRGALGTGLSQLPESAEWVDITDVETRRLWQAFPLWSGLDRVFEPFGLLDGLHDVAEVGTGTVDGVATRRFVASIDPADLLDAWGFGDDALLAGSGADETLDEAVVEEMDRTNERMRKLMVDHTQVDVELHVAEGRLRRSVLTAALPDAADYPECRVFADAGVTTKLAVDYTDLDAGVTVEAPPAESVMSFEDFAAIDLMPDLDDLGLGELGEIPAAGDLEATLTTSAGEMPRWDLWDDLVKFGSVIDVAEDAVFAMDDAELVATWERANTALAAMPRTTTLMGDLTRVELLWNVRWGMEKSGVDPALADGMDDAALAALIDAYVSEFGAGDGRCGPAPELPIEPSGDDAGSGFVGSPDDGELLPGLDEDAFSGCPE